MRASIGVMDSQPDMAFLKETSIHLRKREMPGNYVTRGGCS